MVAGSVMMPALVADMMGEEQANQYAPRKTHFSPKARRVIFINLSGGVSHLDTFDHKPQLYRDHGKEIAKGDHPEIQNRPGYERIFLKTPQWQFKRYGQCGKEVSSLFPEVARCVDDIAFINSMHTSHSNHYNATLGMHTGSFTVTRPSIGAWVSYGLGTENQNLPGYVVMCPGIPVIGPQLWSSAFLPGAYQGSYIRTTENDPEGLVPNLRNPRHGESQQARQLGLLSKLNRAHLKTTGPSPQLEATIHSMEVAYRMQTEGLNAFDVSQESEATRERYGDGDFARGCLLARRLVERGVRMVQVYFGNQQPWDTHQDIQGAMRRLALDSDQPMAELIKDLKASGLLDETLLVIGGEFGRTPTVEVGGLVKVQAGRDHNNHGFSMLLSGGGVKGGVTYGNTDDFGFKAFISQGYRTCHFFTAFLYITSEWEF